MLPHLTSGWNVDQAIVCDENKDRVVVIRFGDDANHICMEMDEHLYALAEEVRNFAVVYLVDTDEVPDFNDLYELHEDQCTIMFFFHGKHIKVDCGTGENNKINFLIHEKEEIIDIIEEVYRGAVKGKGLVISPKDYGHKWTF